MRANLRYPDLTICYLFVLAVRLEPEDPERIADPGTLSPRSTTDLRERTPHILASPFFDPRPQHDFERPSRSMLPMQLKIRLRDVVRVGHVVVDGRSCEAVRSSAVLLGPADCRVDRYVCNVDSLRHQFPRHALGES